MVGLKGTRKERSSKRGIIEVGLKNPRFQEKSTSGW